MLSSLICRIFGHKPITVICSRIRYPKGKRNILSRTGKSKRKSRRVLVSFDKCQRCNRRLTKTERL
jgi:hypothetical protein